MTNAATLAAELANDPAALGYADFLPDSPGSVVDLLNAPRWPMVKALSAARAQTWAALGPYAAIVDASDNPTHPCRASCLVVRATFSAGLPIELDNPELRAMLDAWVTTSICSEAERDDLLARATVLVSRMEVLGLPPATVADVIGAL
jgi:hypothetical protein